MRIGPESPWAYVVERRQLAAHPLDLFRNTFFLFLYAALLRSRSAFTLSCAAITLCDCWRRISFMS